MKTKVIKFFKFTIGCCSHPEKLHYLARLDYENKNCNGLCFGRVNLNLN